MKSFAWAICLLVSVALHGQRVNGVTQQGADAPRSPAETSRQKPVTVPFDLLSTKHIVLMVKINGKGPYRVIFDTGSPVTLINSKVGKETGLLSKDARRPSFTLFGPAIQATMQTLEIGELTAEDVPVIIMDHPTVEIISKKLTPVEGIIGFPFFARYTMSLDYQARQLTFVPNGFEPADTLRTILAGLKSAGKLQKKILVPAALWGFSVDKKAGDEEAGVTITALWLDSPAAKAGLKIGDRLLTLDDRWTDTVADCFVAASYVKPGTEAKIVVKRDGKELELIVRPLTGL